MNAGDLLGPLRAAASFVESMAKRGRGKRGRSLDDGDDDDAPPPAPKRVPGQRPRQGSAGSSQGWTTDSMIALVHHATLLAAEIRAPMPQSIQKTDLDAYDAKTEGNAKKRVEVALKLKAKLVAADNSFSARSLSAICQKLHTLCQDAAEGPGELAKRVRGYNRAKKELASSSVLGGGDVLRAAFRATPTGRYGRRRVDIQPLEVAFGRLSSVCDGDVEVCAEYIVARAQHAQGELNVFEET